MTYPFPELLPHLQILCTPQAYLQTLGNYSQTRGFIPYKNPGYWNIIPNYLYAHCPICRAPYRDPADTYSLRSWGSSFLILHNALYGLAEKQSLPPRCSHFLGIANFTNLHGYVPDELNQFQQKTGEVPYITPWLLPETLEAYAVLHALPICRIEADKFEPHYTVFVLTYFAQRPQLVLQRHYDAQSKWGKDDPEFYPATLAPLGSSTELAGWAERGQLGWLDLTQPDLPLRLGKGLVLPEIYRHIPGKNKPYYWERPSTEPIVRKRG